MQLSNAAAAGADTLQQIIKQKLIEQVERHQMQMAEAKLAEDARQANMQNDLGQGHLGLGRSRLTEDGRQFDAGLGFQKDKFGQDVREYEEAAPQRMATLRYTGAQAGELERRPEAETQERAHEIFMEGLGHKNRLGQIGASGAEDRRTVMARFTTAGQGPAAGSDYTAQRQGRVRESVAELKQMIGPWTTGAGGLLANLPATQARNFKAKLDTLRANIAFGELQEMRNASKTGGALGAVSERELELLSSTLGALDQMQDGAALAGELQKIDDSLTRWEHAKAQLGGAGGAPVELGGGSEFDYVPGKGLVPRGSR